jgi:exodeoxyribonuclease-1
MNAQGKPSFKLTDLTTANGLMHESAHDALSDVHATIALARLIRSAQPRLFDFCFGLHKKDRVMANWACHCGRLMLDRSGMCRACLPRNAVASP